MRHVVPLVLLVTSGAGCATAPRPALPPLMEPPVELSLVARQAELAARCRKEAGVCAELGEALAARVEVSAAQPLAAAYLAEACVRGSSRGCADLAVLRAEGRGIVRDVPRAIDLAKRGCADGAANGCVTWGRLLRRGGAKDEGAALAAFEKGCLLGPAEACAEVGRPTGWTAGGMAGLVVARTAGTAAIEVEPARVSASPAGEGRPLTAWSETCAEAYLQPSLRRVLGLEKEALEAWPPRQEDLALARPLGRIVGHAISGCVCPPGRGITVALRLGPGGRVEQVRTTSPEADACVADQIAKADLPAPAGGTGLLWWTISDYVSKPTAAPPGSPEADAEQEADKAAEASARGCPISPPRPKVAPPPASEKARYRKPREVEKGCTGRAIGYAFAAAGLIGHGEQGTTYVKFAVGKDGSTSRFEFLEPVQDRCDYVLLLKRAVQSCRFEPGLDAKGNPQLIWMVLPLRFAPAR